MLNNLQRAAAHLMSSGHSIFLTGVAGTGKSHTLAEWLSSLPRDTHDKVAVTGSTGVAAVRLRGSTLHRWAGIGLCDRPAYRIVNSDGWMKRAAPRIQVAKTLIIDEVSMVSARVIDTVDAVCRTARISADPFGGLQVILVGDFGQLAPVKERQDGGFAFESFAWGALAPLRVELTDPMRQSDPTFVSLLSKIRRGSLPLADQEMLRSRVKAYDPVERNAVRLMTHNSQVDAVNQQALAKLPEPEQLYTAQESGDTNALETLDKSCLSPRDLRLRIGARVMFTKNERHGLWVNGTTGTVIALKPEYATVQMDSRSFSTPVGQDHWEITEYQEDGTARTAASRFQLPLRLAWALTVHKAQGASLDLASVDLRRCFAPGQAYVALSRVRSLEGLNIEGWRGGNTVFAHPKVVEWERSNGY